MDLRPRFLPLHMIDYEWKLTACFQFSLFDARPWYPVTEIICRGRDLTMSFLNQYEKSGIRSAVWFKKPLLGCWASHLKWGSDEFRCLVLKLCWKWLGSDFVALLEKKNFFNSVSLLLGDNYRPVILVWLSVFRSLMPYNPVFDYSRLI